MPLPIDDSFDGGSPVYDTATLCGSYVRFLGWSSDPSYASSGTGYSVTWTKYGKAYSGHAAVDLGLLASQRRGESINRCVLTTEGQFGFDQGSVLPTGFALRDYAAADVRVSMAFNVKTHVPSTAACVFRIGVAARLSGGTLTDAGTATAHLLGGDGYYFVCLCASLTGVQYQLLRVNSGTVTRLAQTPTGDPSVPANTTAYATWLAANATKTMRLNVHTNGSTVELRAYVKVGSAADTLVLSYDDTSGSRITAAGRCGFLTSNEAASGGNVARCYPLVYFRIRTYAGAIVANDDWTRLCLTGAASVARTFTGGVFPIFGTNFGQNGRDLSSGWFGDLRGDSGFQSRLSRSSDRLLLDSSSTVKTGYYLSQRLADSPREQDRQIDFEFATGGPGTTGLVRGAGIVLRATATAAGTEPESGYVLEAKLDEDSLTASILLSRIVDGALTTIAQKTSGVTITRGTIYTLRLRVETLSVPDPLNGFAKLRAYLDGSQVQLVAASPVALGVQVFSDGTIYDQSSSRVTYGFGEGFYVRSKAAATAHVYVDSWAVGVGSPDPDGEETQATIPIDAEDAAASGTFPVPYDWSSEQEDTVAMVDHRLELDYRYVSPAVDTGRRTLRFGCSAATAAEIASLSTFWEEQRGREIPFTFTWPDGTSSFARFTMDVLKSRMLLPGTPGLHTWEASIEEVADAA